VCVCVCVRVCVQEREIRDLVACVGKVGVGGHFIRGGVADAASCFCCYVWRVHWQGWRKGSHLARHHDKDDANHDREEHLRDDAAEQRGGRGLSAPMYFLARRVGRREGNHTRTHTHAHAHARTQGGVSPSHGQWRP